MFFSRTHLSCVDAPLGLDKSDTRSHTSSAAGIEKMGAEHDLKVLCRLEKAINSAMDSGMPRHPGYGASKRIEEG